MANQSHPYLSGNFAPIHQVQTLTPCSFTGKIPAELGGGEYVRNGGNPVTNENLGRDAHWFDGDGMLTGVAFRRLTASGRLQPEFVNQYVLTDVFLSTITAPFLKTPILPSIATLVNPLSPLIRIILRVIRTLILVALSHLPGSQQAIKKISVANTAIIYHDGRALATCESGVPMRIALPGLESIGWFNGGECEGERESSSGPRIGGSGLLGFMKEWTTAHPRVDPQTAELILFHNTFIPPYVHYSIIPPKFQTHREKDFSKPRGVFNLPIPGIQSAKMMHDFGVSATHTVIMDLPLSLDPLNLLKNSPVVCYNPQGCSRFGIFPRYHPEEIRWFVTNPCCIFHTANSWNSTIPRDLTSSGKDIPLFNMLVCRLTSAALVFSAGDLAAPIPTADVPCDKQEEEQCRLYFYQFILQPNMQTNSQQNSFAENIIRHQWALSAIPFEFPSLADSVSMSAAKYVYGCSVADATFGAALGRSVKINSLVKVNVKFLIAEGIRNPPTQISGCVDTRNIAEVLASSDANDPIKVFMMPRGWYAQEPRFVPRLNGAGEDDGWLLSYVFDESQLDATGECIATARSELWIIDARNMKDIVARVYLPQRVPYGLHGNWFSDDQIQHQRPFQTFRSLPIVERKAHTQSRVRRLWMGLRNKIYSFLS